MSAREILLHLAITLALVVAGLAIYQWQTSATVVPSLVQALERNHLRQRRAVLARLQALGSDARPAAPAVLRLTENLKSRDAPPAFSALARIDLSAAREAMERARDGLRSTDLDTRRRATERLGDLGPLARPALPELIAAARDPDGLVRDRALHALAAIATRADDLLPVLINALDDPHDHVRHSAVVAIDILPPPVMVRALSALRRAASDPSPMVSQRAKHVLTRLESERGIASQLNVARLMLMHNPESILYTLHKLTFLEQEAAPLAPELIELLKHREDSVRYAATETLASIGPPAKVALPALRVLLQDREPVIRDSAQRAIAHIEGGQKP